MPGYCGGFVFARKIAGTLKSVLVGFPRSAGAFSGGFTILSSPQGGDFTGDLLDQKSKSPLSPGGGAVVTND